MQNISNGCYRRTSARTGFTLIELSIVLVIIGLIVGGVLVGQDLIKAAEIRKTLTQYEQYVTAVNTFRTKYNGLPGDMSNATDIWPAADPTPATCEVTETTDTETCNGNGNGLVDEVVLGVSHEGMRFWQQLASAKLIKGHYTGVGDDLILGFGCNRGINCPAGAHSNASWAAIPSNTAGSTEISNHPLMQVWFLGSSLLASGAINDRPYGAFLTTAEAYNIDLKIDDGLPAKGIVMAMAKPTAVLAWLQDGKDCSTNANPDIAKYNLTREGISCSLMFLWRRP